MTIIPKDKRIFLVCRSKKCPVVRGNRIRCTISMASDNAYPYLHDTIPNLTAQSLTNRGFCVKFSNPSVSEAVSPQWGVSPDKPGLRNQLKKEMKAETDFLVDNPDFLEV